MLEQTSKKDFDPYKADFDKSDQDLYKEIIAEQQKQRKERSKRA